MKIEKINDNQIRCTVTMADLHDRHLKISELITNSAKAKLLLQDMVQQAAAEFGFDVDGMSLMIETAPAAKDAVVFTITRLTGDEQPFGDLSDPDSPALSKLLGAESIAHFIQKLRSSLYHEDEPDLPLPEERSCCIFSFENLEQVIQTADVFSGLFDVKTSLYKDDMSMCYLLVVCKNTISDQEFNRACNMLSEYAALEETDRSILSYIHEHNRLIIADNALEVLAQINKPE